VPADYGHALNDKMLHLKLVHLVFGRIVCRVLSSYLGTKNEKASAASSKEFCGKKWLKVVRF